jgi:arylformamidase
MSNLIDLSHEIEDGMITYKGLPAPVICDFLSRERSRSIYEPGTEFQIGKIEMVANTGTYVDCPFHRYEHRKDLSDVQLEAFANLPGICVRADYNEMREVGVDLFANLELKGKAVLINTNWSVFWRTDRYFETHPFVTAEAAEFLRDQKVALVGIDSHNIDDTRGNRRPVHSILLGADILIVEHMTNLAAVPDRGFYFNAVPPKFKGVGTFPVRAYAEIIQGKKRNP